MNSNTEGDLSNTEGDLSAHTALRSLQRALQTFSPSLILHMKQWGHTRSPSGKGTEHSHRLLLQHQDSSSLTELLSLSISQLCSDRVRDLGGKPRTELGPSQYTESRDLGSGKRSGWSRLMQSFQSLRMWALRHYRKGWGSNWPQMTKFKHRVRISSPLATLLCCLIRVSWSSTPKICNSTRESKWNTVVHFFYFIFFNLWD